MTVGERIKKRRENNDISQTELAKRVGVSKQSLYKYETNIVTNIPSDVIEKIANVLNISPCRLMGWEDKEQTKASQFEILQYYNKLNTLGKEAATEQVRLLTLDGKYTRPDQVVSIVREPEPGYLAPDAAHSREGADAADQEYDNKEIMDNDALWKN